MNHVARIIKDLLIEEESRDLSAKSAEELIRNFDRIDKISRIKTSCKSCQKRSLQILQINRLQSA
jgi:hypothetical protein